MGGRSTADSARCPCVYSDGAKHEWSRIWDECLFRGGDWPAPCPWRYPLETMKIEKHNIVRGKLNYAKGARPDVECILCGVACNDPKVDNLVVYREQGYFVTLNLYPYNPGHLMVVPERHMEDIREFTEADTLEMHRMQVLSIAVLEKVYRPNGFNVGYNLGDASGASIPHLHLQIVPRYRTELGFFDLLSDSRVIVEAPEVTREKLQSAFAEAGAAADSRGAPGHD